MKFDNQLLDLKTQRENLRDRKVTNLPEGISQKAIVEDWSM